MRASDFSCFQKLPAQRLSILRSMCVQPHSLIQPHEHQPRPWQCLHWHGMLSLAQPQVKLISQLLVLSCATGCPMFEFNDNIHRWVAHMMGCHCAGPRKPGSWPSCKKASSPAVCCLTQRQVLQITTHHTGCHCVGPRKPGSWPSCKKAFPQAVCCCSPRHGLHIVTHLMGCCCAGPRKPGLWP